MEAAGCDCPAYRRNSFGFDVIPRRGEWISRTAETVQSETACAVSASFGQTQGERMIAPKRTGPIAVLKTLAEMAEQAEKHFITVMTLVFGLILLYNLILRAFNIQGLTWIEEFSRYMLAVTTLMGCSIAAKHKGHMVMDTAISFLPIRPGQIVQGLGYLLCGAMYVYLGYYAWRWTGRLIAMNRSVECVNFPLWPIWVLATYAIITMGLRYLVQTVKSFVGAIRGEAIVSEQEAEIARAIAEEKERQKAQADAAGRGDDQW